ncbi:MAG: hypothetical protein LBI48_11605 [Burkholderiaceae bacterium]|jgi:hypothetical protein|nr:hypothetical protein [Burkholderiaceae bacterium]
MIHGLRQSGGNGRMPGAPGFADLFTGCAAHRNFLLRFMIEERHADA